MLIFADVIGISSFLLPLLRPQDQRPLKKTPQSSSSIQRLPAGPFIPFLWLMVGDSGNTSLPGQKKSSLFKYSPCRSVWSPDIRPSHILIPRGLDLIL